MRLKKISNLPNFLKSVTRFKKMYASIARTIKPINLWPGEDINGPERCVSSCTWMGADASWTSFPKEPLCSCLKPPCCGTIRTFRPHGHKVRTCFMKRILPPAARDIQSLQSVVSRRNKRRGHEGASLELP